MVQPASCHPKIWGIHLQSGCSMVHVACCMAQWCTLMSRWWTYKHATAVNQLISDFQLYSRSLSLSLSLSLWQLYHLYVHKAILGSNLPPSEAFMTQTRCQNRHFSDNTVRGHNLRHSSPENSQTQTPNILRRCETPYIPPYRRWPQSPTPSPSPFLPSFTSISDLDL